MIQQLVILGFLKKEPLSGYDIKKKVNKDLGIFSQIDNKSIYYPLQQMSKNGYIKLEKIKLNKYPQKQLYSITSKGEDLFLKLCQQALSSTKRPFIELDIALYFLPFIDKKKAQALLRFQLKFLEKVKEWLKEKKLFLKTAPKNLQLLIEHHQRLAITEQTFIANMINELKKDGKGGAFRGDTRNTCPLPR